MARLKKVIKKAAEQKKPDPVPVVQGPPPYQPQTPISHEAKKAMYRQLEEHWDTDAEHYGWDDPERPENVTRRMQAVLGAPDLETAHEAARKARDTIQIMILGAWAKGKIPGPTTERSVEQRVKRAESLAQMLEKKGQDEAAERQWARAAKLREQLEEIREESRG